MNKSEAIQDVLFPTGTCYGCGPHNPEGMHLKSYWSEDGNYLMASYLADAKYNAGLPNVMYGGTVASLIDCHSIWTAIAFTYQAEDRPLGSKPGIGYVTGNLSVKYMKPTPLDTPVLLRSWVEGDIGHKTRVLCELGTEDGVTAMGDVVAVRLE